MNRNIVSTIFRHLLRLVAISLFAILVSTTIVAIFGNRKTSQLTLVSDDTYLQIFYTIFHKIGARERPDTRDFVIFNVHHNSLSLTEERKKIAETLTQIAEQNPKLVVFDISMARRDSLSDRQMEEALSLFDRNHLVVVTENDGDNLVQSFFNEGEQYRYGSANIPDFYRYSSMEGPTPRLVSVAASILSGEGGPPDSAEEEKTIVIDYRDIDIPSISSLADMKANLIDSLGGKIVIIGDCDDPLDLKQCPFYVGIQRVVSGVRLNAILIHSLYSEKNHFHYVGDFCNMLICLLMTFVFSCLYFILDLLERNTKRRGHLARLLSHFIKPVFLLAGEALLLLVSVIIFTAWLGLFISPFPAMIAIIFVEPFFQIIYREI